VWFYVPAIFNVNMLEEPVASATRNQNLLELGLACFPYLGKKNNIG
jgi:hypothetical protein